MLSGLAAPRCGFQGVIDPCLTDLQKPGHRQTDEGEKELILSPTPKQAATACKPLILRILIQKMKIKQAQPTSESRSPSPRSFSITELVDALSRGI